MAMSYDFKLIPFNIASPEKMRALPDRPFSPSSARMRSTNSELAWMQTTTMKISASQLRLFSTSAPPQLSRRWTPSPNGSSESLSRCFCYWLDEREIARSSFRLIHYKRSIGWVRVDCPIPCKGFVRIDTHKLINIDQTRHTLSKVVSGNTLT